MRLLWITVGTFRHSIYLLSRSKTKQQNYWNACYWMQKYFSQCINAEITNSCSHYFVNNCAFLFKATHIAKFPCKRERIKSFCFMFGRTFKQHERWNMVVFNRFVFQLPGIDTIRTYNFRFGRTPILIAELPLALNPTGCIRSEKFRKHHATR